MSAAPRNSAIAIATALAVLCGSGSAAAQAIDYRSVSERTIAFDSPSENGRRVLILNTGTPVEVISTETGWVRVREPGGSLNWVASAALSSQRTLLVTAERTQVRREAREDAPVVFEATRNVVLQLLEIPHLGWVKVRHADGDEGYVRVSEVWGL